MVAYSFNKRFVAPILAGTKAQTIRAARKRHVRPGEELQLYTGMRTKACKLIGRPVCLSVCPIILQFRGSDHMVTVNRIGFYRPGMLNDFARDDGFADWDDMRAFWREHHPDVSVFEGVLIRWDGEHFARQQ